MLAAFAALGVGQEVLKQIEKLDFTKHLVFSDGKEPYKIDFITYVSGVDFQEAWGKKVITEMDGLTIPFIHLDHLIVTKITTERLSDKVDVERLQKIQRLRENEDN